MGVLKEYHRQGLGRKLFEAAKKIASAKTQLVWLYDEMYNVSVESVKKGTVINTRARTTKLEEYDENKNLIQE